MNQYLLANVTCFNYCFDIHTMIDESIDLCYDVRFAKCKYRIVYMLNEKSICYHQLRSSYENQFVSREPFICTENLFAFSHVYFSYGISWVSVQMHRCYPRTCPEFRSARITRLLYSAHGPEWWLGWLKGKFPRKDRARRVLIEIAISRTIVLHHRGDELRFSRESLRER